MRTKEEMTKRQATLNDKNDRFRYRRGLLDWYLAGKGPKFNTDTVDEQAFVKTAHIALPELEHTAIRRDVDLYNKWMAHYAEWLWMCRLDDLSARCALESWAPFSNPALVLEIKTALDALMNKTPKQEEILPEIANEAASAHQQTFPEVEINLSKVTDLAMGVKLDALVARYVFGWQKVYIHSNSAAGVPEGREITDDNFIGVPKYSTVADAAVAILNKYEDSDAITICLASKAFRIYGLWSAQIIQKGKFGYGMGETIPHAICKAALELNLK